MLLVSLGVGCLFLLLRARKLQQRISRLDRDNAKLNEVLSSTRARVQELARFEPIADVEAHLVAQQSAARRVIDEAKGVADAMISNAAVSVEQTKREGEVAVAEARSRAASIVKAAVEESERGAERIRTSLANDRRAAEAQVAESRLQANKNIETAREQSRTIVAEAERRAKEVAGEALQAVRDAKRVEAIAKAMQNVIEGYGDRYLVPTVGLLDELSEELSYTEAGVKLKAARARVRDLIKRNEAANCDYVEPNRRETAIHFVLDAFMGKCDAILADVRHDNYGTLQQKIRDAAYLVSKNGEAFRNARIELALIDARLDELKWAVAAHEIKQREREEQRVLKERIREEERAQREFERAMKDAAKEEDTLKKAMEKARKEVERASDEQRASFEAKLADLSERLRIAEEKRQRAKSLAEQTKQGVVYVISNVGSFGEHVYKIGMTRRYEPLERVRELGDASVPFEFDVHALIRAEDAPALERELHKRCVRHQVNKVNPRKEFFRVSLNEIRKIADSIGCQAAWTMTAEAREYKETLALEESMAAQPQQESAWVERQLKVQDSLPPEPENDSRLEMAS